jgi:ribosomal protein L14
MQSEVLTAPLIRPQTNKQIERQTDTYISFMHAACLLSKYGNIPTGNVGLVLLTKEFKIR